MSNSPSQAAISLLIGDLSLLPDGERREDLDRPGLELSRTSLVYVGLSDILVLFSCYNDDSLKEVECYRERVSIKK